jgi:glycerophosphoryl diester phosphodiesterase
MKPSINDPEITLTRIKEAIDAFRSAYPEAAIHARTYLNCWNLEFCRKAKQLLPECKRIYLALYSPELGYLSYLNDVVLGNLAPGLLRRVRTFLFGFDVKSASWDIQPTLVETPNVDPDPELFGYSIHSKFLGLTPNFARNAQARGQRVQVWTCNTEEALVRAVDWLGATCVLTDRPAYIRKVQKGIVESLGSTGS